MDNTPPRCSNTTPSEHFEQALTRICEGTGADAEVALRIMLAVVEGVQSSITRALDDIQPQPNRLPTPRALANPALIAPPAYAAIAPPAYAAITPPADPSITPPADPAITPPADPAITPPADPVIVPAIAGPVTPPDVPRAAPPNVPRAAPPAAVGPVRTNQESFEWYCILVGRQTGIFRGPW